MRPVLVFCFSALVLCPVSANNEPMEEVDKSDAELQDRRKDEFASTGQASMAARDPNAAPKQEDASPADSGYLTQPSTSSSSSGSLYNPVDNDIKSVKVQDLVSRSESKRSQSSTTDVPPEARNVVTGDIKMEMGSSTPSTSNAVTTSTDLCSMALTYDSASTDVTEPAPVQHYSQPLLEAVPELDAFRDVEFHSDHFSATFSAMSIGATNSSQSRTDSAVLQRPIRISEEVDSLHAEMVVTDGSHTGGSATTQPSNHPFSVSRYAPYPPSSSTVRDPHGSIDVHALPPISTFQRPNSAQYSQVEPYMPVDQPSTSRGQQDHIYHGEYFWHPQLAAPNDPNFEQFYDPNASENGSNGRLDGQNGNDDAVPYGYNEELHRVQNVLNANNIPVGVGVDIDDIFIEPGEQAPYQNPNAGGNQRTWLLMEFIFNSALDARNEDWIQWTGDGSARTQLWFTINLDEAAHRWNLYKYGRRSRAKEPGRDFAHQLRIKYATDLQLTGEADHTYRFFREAVEGWWNQGYEQLLAAIAALMRSYTRPMQLKMKNKKSNNQQQDGDDQ